MLKTLLVVCRYGRVSCEVGDQEEELLWVYMLDVKAAGLFIHLPRSLDSHKHDEVAS